MRVPLCAMQFCGENLTHGARKNKGSGPGASKGLQAKSGSRIRTCPACVKPLPRCSVCMLAMDAANPAAIDTSRRQKLQLQPAKLGQQPPNVRTTLANSLFALADNASRNVARCVLCRCCYCHQVDAAAAGFERWFTWCQCCHHGGHAECLRSWFELHTVCPVSGCKCICLSKDVS